MKTIRDNWPMIATVAPFAIVTLRVFLMSRGDVTVMMAIIGNSSVTQVLLGTFVPLVPLALLAWILNLYISGRLRRGLASDEWTWGSIEAQAAVLMFLSFLFLLPFSAALAFAGLFLYFAAARWISKKRNKKRASEPRSHPVDAAAVLVFGAMVLLNQPMWYPAEVITLDGKTPQVGFILDESDPVTLLWNDRGIEKVDVEKIEKRAYCRLGSAPLYTRLPGPVVLKATPSCPD